MAEEQNTGIKGAVPSEPCLATVISHLDTTYMGSLEVKILRPGAGQKPYRHHGRKKSGHR